MWNDSKGARRQRRVRWGLETTMWATLQFWSKALTETRTRIPAQGSQDSTIPKLGPIWGRGLISPWNRPKLIKTECLILGSDTLWFIYYICPQILISQKCFPQNSKQSHNGTATLLLFPLPLLFLCFLLGLFNKSKDLDHGHVVKCC